MTQTAVRTLIDHDETNPVALLNSVNRTIYHNIQRMNVDKSLTFAFLAYQEGRMTLAGQHEELLLVRRDGQVERRDTIDLGFPIGLQENIAAYVSTTSFTLQPGDGIVLYTDGVTEAENAAGELYGLDRLCTAVSRAWPQSAAAIQQAVIADVTRFIGDHTVYDDLTLVVLKQM
jgi:serine phosphatase RsbU (regulator of sigma subunit)